MATPPPRRRPRARTVTDDDDVAVWTGSGWVYNNPREVAPKNTAERLGDFPLGGDRLGELRKNKQASKRQWEALLSGLA